MTSFLTNCTNKIGEKLMDVIIAEARYICCFKCIGEDFEKAKEDLKAYRNDAATFRQQEVDNLSEEDIKTKKACFWGWCPNCIWQYRRGKEMAQKTEGIRRLMELNSGSAGLTPRLPDVEYHSSQDYIHFKSRESDYKELLDALLDDKNYMIGLQGLGGTGKTTLANEVGKELKKSKQFDYVIDTTVSNTPDIKKIQDDIAGPLGLPLKDLNESDRPKKLWKRLVDAKKVLIILDDVWDWKHIDFEDIGIPKDHKGCKVLLTTRNLRICHVMECQRIIQLEILCGEDAWNMFKNYADISDNSKLEAKGQEIAKECKGLPVAIAVIAGSLKGRQDLEEWNAALIALQRPMPWHGDDENLIEIYKCLRYSYDNMRNEKAKELFLICSIFQEDEEIPTEILTRFGIGVGLFEDVDKYHAARSQVVVAKNKLIDSCLLLKTEEGHVKMHDLVREAALWIANKEIQAIKLSNKNQKALVEREKNIRYLLCEGQDKDVFSCSFDGAKLEILVICINANDEVEFPIPDAFFERMIGLRVLYLSRNGWERPALSLQQLHQSLTIIRSLFLEGLILGEISVLGTLRRLETLDLIDCEIHELPNKFTDLAKLRLLSLEGCEIKMNNPFEVIERCLPLEELYFRGNIIRQVESVNKVEAIHQNKAFPRLQRYHVTGHHEQRDDSISKFFGNEGIDALISEATFKYLLQKAEILRLEGIKGESRNLIPEIVLMENDLVELRLTSCSKLQHLIDTLHDFPHVQNVFSKLVDLQLYSMDNLEELCSGPLPINLLKSLERLHIEQCGHLRSILFKSKLNLCNLKTMNLTFCPMLVSLFQLSTARSLVLLEELRISECEQLTNIMTAERTGQGNGEEIVDGDNDHKSWGSMFPNLKTLDITGCDLLEFILPLSARDVQECYHPVSSSVKRSSSKDGSKAQFQSNPAKCNIFPWTHICWYAQKFRRKLGSTTSTTSPVASNDKLQDYSVSSESNSERLHLWERAQCISKQSQMLRNIREMELSYLPKIKSLFILSTAQIMLLETLKIENCYELKHIIIDIADDRVGRNWGDVFPKLKMLSVEGCHQLEYVFVQYPHDHQNYSENHLHLPALEKVIFCSLPKTLSICPQNYSTAWPALKEFELTKCPHITIKSIGELMVDLDSRQLDSTATKESNSECLCLWQRAQSLSKQSHMLHNIREIELNDLSRVKSVFVLSFAQTMLLETLKIQDCDKLKNIIVVIGDYRGGRNWGDVFPKLKMLYVEGCRQLEYVFGQYPHDHQNYNETHLHLPELEKVILRSLPNFISICPKNYSTTWPALKEFELNKCPLFTIKSIRELMVDLDSRQLHSTATKKSNSEGLRLRQRAQCLSKQSHMLHNIGEIELNDPPSVKSVFVLSIAQTTLLETLKIQDCDKLKHIIVVIGDYRGGRKWGDVFPKLKMLYVEGCGHLEYVFGQYPHDHQNYNKTHLHLPALEKVKLRMLPKFISVCPKNCRTTWPPLKEFELNECHQFTAIKSIGELMVDLDSRQLDSATTKDLRENVKHFLTLEKLDVVNSNVESIFRLNGHHLIGQQISLGLQSMKLHNLHQMTNICLGSKNPFTLQNLKDLRIVGCEKLEVIFAASILSCLPQLRILWIENCNELKQIIEDDVKNQKLPNQLYLKPHFPKLGYLIITQCNKLKRFFPVSTSKELPKLEFLMIREASELEEVFGCEQSNLKVELPDLKCVIFMQLPSLCQDIQLQTVRFRIVDNCPKLSMTSSTTTVFPLHPLVFYWGGFELAEIHDTDEFLEMLCELINSAVPRHYDNPRSDVDSVTQGTSNRSPTAEITKDFPVAPEVPAASGHELPSLYVNTNQSMQADPPNYNENDVESNGLISVGTKTKCTAEPEKKFVERVPGLETEDQSIEKGSMSEKTVTTTLSTDSETKNTSPGPLLDPLQKSIKRSVEEGTTSENGKKVTLSTHSESVSTSSGPLVTSKRNTYPQEGGDGQIPRTCSVGTTEHPATKDVDVRGSHEASEFVVTTIEIQAPGFSESKPSPRIPFPVTTQAPSLPKDVLPFEGNSSQIEEDSNLASLVTRELEQLVSSKHLAPKNLSLLIDFLVKHPSVRLIDKINSDKYKGFAYSCLADLLIFLQTHSALEVLRSSRSDFVKLLQDVRSLGFDKDWLDAVERRAFFHGIQVSQDALQKLLDSKHILTQHVEDLKHQLASSEAVLESIIQQEAQVLEARAALSAPLGY